MITAGGTATAWHIAKTIKLHMPNAYEVHICDCNRQELIPAVKYADFFYQMPMIVAEDYRSAMYRILKEKQIDIIVPLIDMDLKLFASDSDSLKRLGVRSSAPCKKTFEALSDKAKLPDSLERLGIPALSLYTQKETVPENRYLLKPRIGFGSRGTRVIWGKDIQLTDISDCIIQEYVQPVDDIYEITAEVYQYANEIRVFMRSRIEVKEGVCTKMQPTYEKQIEEEIKKLVDAFEMPIASNIQFLLHEGKWRMNDVNLRLGAGTALSTACGFQLTRACMETLKDEQSHVEYLMADYSIQSVCRVYEEVVSK